MGTALESLLARAEWLGMALALAMVACNMRVNPWGWPLACLSSVLYGLVFWRSGLYGEAGLQVFFALMALWGWGQWLRTPPPAPQAPDPARPSVRDDLQRLGRGGRVRLLAVLAVAWLLLGLLLDRSTDSDVPWWDALPTGASVVATWLLARKYIENWWVWAGVNLVSIGLFAHKQLWPTAALYALFTVLSLWGWQVWRRRMRDAASPAAT